MSHQIRFNAVDHSYWIGDTQLQSVTSLIKTLIPPFDSDRVSAHCAKRDGITQAEVLAQWQAKANASTAKGTRVHSYIEDVLDGIHDPVLTAVNTKIPEMCAFDAAWQLFRDNLRAEVAQKETIVGDEQLRVAGRIDVVLSIQPQSTRFQSVFDWKTGKFERYNRFENLLPPFDDLTASELNKYSIQVSTYRLLLERADPAASYGESYLVHLHESGTHHVYKAIDLRERVLAWLSARALNNEIK